MKLLLLILITAIFIICYYFGQEVSIKNQLPLFEGLRNTSAIIFGVMGAWLAILHPTSLKKIFSKNKESISDEDRKTINILLSPILISTFILSIVLVAPLFIVVGRSIPSLYEYVEIFRGVSFLLLGGLTVLQLWSLVLTLIPSDILKRLLQKDEARQKIKKRMFSGTRSGKNL